MQKKYIGLTAAFLLGISAVALSTIACADNDINLQEAQAEEVFTLDGPGMAKEFKKEKEVIYWNEQAVYADESVIHTGTAMLYYSQAAEKKNKTVCINAGHGTDGGWEYTTYCHPDHSPKTTGGSTGEGSLKATCISEGTTLYDGTPESEATLELALLVRERLLEAGYNVLMLRESSDVQLDNIARTVLANQYADCHIALHYDSTEYNKGAFVINVPDIWEYRNMEPVASHWQEHNRLGECVIDGFTSVGVPVFSDGYMGIDLTQTSYSTIPSIDVEVGDRASDHSKPVLLNLAEGILAGVNLFFSN